MKKTQAIAQPSLIQPSLGQSSLITQRQRAQQLIEQYFETFNQQAFDQTAALFAAQGSLTPPFEGAIVGREKIQAYLEKKAANMHAQPEEWNFPAEGDAVDNKQPLYRVAVQGRVKAIVFQVSVLWEFAIAPTCEIAIARVKLIATPKELLSLRSVH